jgi:hypothetical protein
MKSHFALHYCVCNIPSLLLFLLRRNSPSGPGPPHCRGFTITRRYTTLGRTLRTELSSRRRDFHLTTHNTDKRQTYRHPAGFEATERSQTHALDRAATGIGSLLLAFSYMNPVRSLSHILVKIHFIITHPSTSRSAKSFHQLSPLNSLLNSHLSHCLLQDRLISPSFIPSPYCNVVKSTNYKRTEVT